MMMSLSKIKIKQQVLRKGLENAEKHRNFVLLQIFAALQGEVWNDVIGQTISIWLKRTKDVAHRACYTVCGFRTFQTLPHHLFFSYNFCR
jgi:hypothetical protein